MKVSAVVVSHGHRAELAESLPALVPQVDEARRDRERARLGARRTRYGARVIENRTAGELRGQHQRRHARDHG